MLRRTDDVSVGSPAEQADGMPSLRSLAPSSTDSSTSEVGKASAALLVVPRDSRAQGYARDLAISA
jgi:hypothetical protein